MTSADRSPSGHIAAEPAYCPGCDLKHVRQPDWLCPRCGMPVETEAWRSATRAPAAETEAPPEFPMGSLVAGAVLTLTGLVLALGFARNPATEHRWPLVAATVILAVLGLELLLKVASARWVAIAIALVVLIVASEDLFRARMPELLRDPLPAGLRGALHGLIGSLPPPRLLTASGLLGGTLLLVAGRPGRGRIAAGALVAASLAVAEVVRWLLP